MDIISETYNCDCMDFMRILKDNAFDLAIIDPPYGIGVTKMNMGSRQGYESTVCRLGRQHGNTPCDWDDEIPSGEFFEELFRVSRNQVIFGGNYFKLPPTRCVCVWDKLQTLPNFSQVEVAWTSFDAPAKIFRKGTVGGDNLVKKIHPVQKPVELYGWLLREFAHEGDKILDTHMGSQSSRIAAYKMGFDYYGCEIDKLYYETGEKRFREECLDIENIGGREYVQKNLFWNEDNRR